MLTSDLVRVRRKGEAITAQYLRGPAIERLTPVVRYYVETLSGMVGRPREEIEAALDAAEVTARDRLAALGLRKVLEDRAEFEVAEGIDPEALRREVFLAAAEAHRTLDVRAELDRAAVLAAVAEKLGTTPESLERGLYADLRGSELLQRFTPMAPEEALERYNLGLAQAILLRATKVTVHLEGEEPSRYRQVFRAARFQGLIHVVRSRPEGGYTIDLDGPYSLFDAVSRYGLKLALFLPAVLACRAYHVEASVLWGRERTPSRFTVKPVDELTAPAPDLPSTAPDLELFCEAFERLTSAWTVAKNERIFALPGEVVCVPDLVFSSRETGEEVYLEAFGFWSRASVWQRVELVQKGFPCRILLAVSKQLRVSEEVLGEEDTGEVYVYKRVISPREVLERLERGKPPARKRPKP